MHTAILETTSQFGGMVTRARDPNGYELIWCESVPENSGRLRGGIPVLFPQAWSLRDTQTYSLPQHGFARDMTWEEWHSTDDTIELLLDTQSRWDAYGYPFRFHLIQRATWQESELIVDLIVRNVSATVAPLALGLHPYLFVPNDLKSRVEVDIDGFRSHSSWLSGEVSIYDRDINRETISLSVPGFWAYILQLPQMCRSIWAWTYPDSDSICIEPMMWWKDALLDNPYYLAADTEFHYSLGIRFQPF